MASILWIRPAKRHHDLPDAQPHRQAEGWTTTALPENDDRDLVRRARVDRSAFGELYERYVGRVYSYLYARTGNRHEAEDLAARVFVQALDHLQEFDSDRGSFSGWLFTIAHNLAANWFRSRSRRRQAPLETAEGREWAGDGIEQVVEMDSLRRAMAALPPERQHLVALRFVEGLSHAQIGRILGRSEGAVRALLLRTLRSLRQELAAEHDRSGGDAAPEPLQSPRVDPGRKED